MVMPALAYVDSPEALGLARANAGNAVIVTDNPWLEAAAERDGAAIVNIERTLTPADVLTLGQASIRLANAVDRVLPHAIDAAATGLVPEHLRLAGTTSRLIASLVHRAAVMARALDAHHPDQIHLYTVDTPDWIPVMPFQFARFASPYPPSAEAGFFADRQVRTTPVATVLPEAVNQTASEDLAQRVAMLPGALLRHEVVRRLAPWHKARGPRIGIGGENEGLREALPYLAAAGLRPLPVGRLTATSAADGPPPTGDTILPALRDAARTTLADGLSDIPAFTAEQTAALTEVLLIRLARGLEAVAGQWPRLRDHLDRVTAAIDRPGIVLTNGLFGPLGGQIYHHLHARGFMIVDVEHGVTTGLAALSASRMHCSEAAVSDVLLVSSDRARSRFETAQNGGRPVVETVGLADQTRRLFRPRLQRWLARRRLGARKGETTIMHVSTWTHSGNMRPGWGTPSETAVYDLERRLIEEAYAGLRHSVLYKPYPTQRLAYEPPHAQAIPPSPPVRYVPDDDFRYLRAAADVIVTGTPTSTLGWCVGTDRPLIYLDSRLMNPLEDEDLRRRFAEGFLVVDLDDPDWPAALRRLLDRPLGDIAADWHNRAPARRALLADSISGPPGCTGRRIADVVAGLIAESAKPSLDHSAGSPLARSP